MVIRVVIRVPAVPLSFLLAIAESALAGVAEASGFGPVAPLVVAAMRREAARRLELDPALSRSGETPGDRRRRPPCQRPRMRRQYPRRTGQAGCSRRTD